MINVKDHFMNIIVTELQLLWLVQRGEKR